MCTMCAARMPAIYGWRRYAERERVGEARGGERRVDLWYAAAGNQVWDAVDAVRRSHLRSHRLRNPAPWTGRIKPDARDNQRPGTDAWRPYPNHQATTQIQAYASDVSVQAGDTITFYVSVQDDGD